jgi:hypothetical protein
MTFFRVFVTRGVTRSQALRHGHGATANRNGPGSRVAAQQRGAEAAAAGTAGEACRGPGV